MIQFIKQKHSTYMYIIRIKDIISRIISHHIVYIIKYHWGFIRCKKMCDSNQYLSTKFGLRVYLERTIVYLDNHYAYNQSQCIHCYIDIYIYVCLLLLLCDMLRAMKMNIAFCWHCEHVIDLNIQIT